MIENSAGRLLAAALVAGSLAVPSAANSQEAAANPATAMGSGRPELSPMSRVAAARAEAAENGEEDNRVYGGHEASPGAWPFQVALLTSGMLDDSLDSQPNAQFCGGSLIAPDWVLTAAHCLFDAGAPVDAASITVLTSAHNLNEGTRHKVTQVIVHEGYSELTMDNDIGLIRLADKASEPAIPMEVAPETGKATVTGWGRMEDGTFPMALMQAELDLEPNNACNSGIKEVYARDLDVMLRDMSSRMRYSDKGISGATAAITGDMSDPLSPNMVCAGTADGARDACNGDSGGPLFMTGADGKPMQVGVVSWGEGPFDSQARCGYQNAYGVYTRLGNYRDWIKGKAGI